MSNANLEARVGIAALVLRVALGAIMAAHGLAKVFLFTLPGTAAFFENVGFPGFMAYPVAALEIVGGALLIVGVLTRWVALAMVPVLIGATSVHVGNGWMFTALNGGWEFPAYLIAAALAQFVLGADGSLSMGAWLATTREPASSNAAPAAARRGPATQRAA